MPDELTESQAAAAEALRQLADKPPLIRNFGLGITKLPTRAELVAVLAVVDILEPFPKDEQKKICRASIEE